MIALFYNRMLSNADICEIANRLNNKTPDDVLAQIIGNWSDNDNNNKLFENYLNARGIKFADYKRALIAKVFYYILHDRIDLYKGISFVYFNVSKHENIIKYCGDDVGIELIYGNYSLIADGDLRNEKDIEKAVEFIIRDLKQYVNEYLVEFPLDNNISKDNKKIVIKAEMEEKVKAKAFAKGIEAKNHWDKLWEEARKKKDTQGA
jgi:hypothetical protein